MRLFVALSIPKSLKEDLSPISNRFSYGVSAENMHLTLKFLGEINEEKLKKVIAALNEVRFSSFTLSTTKIGSFPRVLWLGVKLTKALAQLQQDVARAVRPFTTHDPRAYKPHITIARFENIDERKLVDSLLKQRIEEKWNVDRFLLMRSHSVADGAVYSVVEIFGGLAQS